MCTTYIRIIRTSQPYRHLWYILAHAISISRVAKSVFDSPKRCTCVLRIYVYMGHTNVLYIPYKHFMCNTDTYNTDLATLSISPPPPAGLIASAAEEEKAESEVRRGRRRMIIIIIIIIVISTLMVYTGTFYIYIQGCEVCV
jgi:hypothetical protein